MGTRRIIAFAWMTLLLGIVSGCSGQSNMSAPYGTEGKTAGPASPAAPLPVFKLPAPKPSAIGVLASRYIAAGDTLGTIADRLETVLDNAGYTDRSFFSTPGGFAMATRMERVDAEGKPFAGAARWDIAAAGLLKLGEHVSIGSLVSALQHADPGHYRMLIFCVTDVSVTATAAPMESERAQDLVVTGASALPSEYDKKPAGSGYRITVLIYEFKRTKIGGPAEFSSPSNVPGALQLTRSGIPVK